MAGETERENVQILEVAAWPQLSWRESLYPKAGQILERHGVLELPTYHKDLIGLYESLR